MALSGRRQAPATPTTPEYAGSRPSTSSFSSEANGSALYPATQPWRTVQTQIYPSSSAAELSLTSMTLLAVPRVNRPEYGSIQFRTAGPEFLPEAGPVPYGPPALSPGDVSRTQLSMDKPDRIRRR